MSSMGHGSFVKTEILFRNFVPRQLLVTWGFPALCFALLMTCCLLQNFFFFGGGRGGGGGGNYPVILFSGD